MCNKPYIKSMNRYYVVVALIVCSAFGEIFLDEKYEHGFIPLGEHRYHAELYYMLFRSRDENPTAPLVWFFEGGPGMTGMHAIFYQNGPYRINKDMTLRKNEYSFNNIADVLYIDQPIGTGFSNVTNTSWVPHHEDVILGDLVHFLQAFLEKHQEYHGRPLYLVSQAYGSHFVLPLASTLARHVVPFANLQGIALGNPWIRPEIQLTTLPAFSKRHQLCSELHYIASLYGYILASVFIDLDLDMQALDIVEMATGVLVGIRNHKFNRYDIRIKCSSGPCMYNFTDLHTFLDRPDVRRIMGTTDRHFNITSFEVFRWLVLNNEYFSDKSPSLIHIIDDTHIPVYIFTGMQDWLINYVGMDQFMDSLHWSGREQMKGMFWRDWYTDGQFQGRYKRVKNLYYVHVIDAGHYVGMDLPSFTLDLLTRLTYGAN